MCESTITVNSILHPHFCIILNLILFKKISTYLLFVGWCKKIQIFSNVDSTKAEIELSAHAPMVGNKIAGAAECTCSRREITWVNEAHLPLTKLGHIQVRSAPPTSSFPLPPTAAILFFLIYIRYILYSRQWKWNSVSPESLDFDSSRLVWHNSEMFWIFSCLNCAY